MAKVTLSFEIENVNEEDTYEIEESVKEVLFCGAEHYNYLIHEIQFIEFETEYEEENEEQ